MTITVFSVACHFYNPTGLAALGPTMCFMNFVLSEDQADKLHTAVDQILKSSELSFP